MLTDEEVTALKNKYPGVILDLIENEIVSPGISFVVKRANDLEWQRYRAEQANDEQAPMANRRLVLGQIVRPEPKEFLAMLVDRPGLVETLASKIRENAGASNASTSRKL